MNILVLDEEFPYPLNSGKRIRSFNLLKRIARSHTIRYLSYGRVDSEGYAALAREGMHPIAVKRKVPDKSGVGFYFRLFANLFSKDPYIVTSHFSSVFQTAVVRELALCSPDLVLCEWSPYAVFVRDLQSVKTVLVAHNVESRIWQRYYENETHPLKKWYIGRQWRKVSRFEKEVFTSADAGTAVSAAEASELSALNQSLSVELVENGVDLEYFQPQPQPNNRRQIVFTGSMDWRPNQDAVLFFVKEIFPRLRSRMPHIEAVFVGRNAPPHIMNLNRLEGIQITGTVEDVRPYVRRSAVYVVPLRIGGGSRLKILEAFAMSCPVVSTTVGAEGLDVTDGENILLADSIEQFCSKIELLMKDRELAERLGHAGRTLVENRYSWDSVAKKLETFLIKTVNAK